MAVTSGFYKSPEFISAFFPDKRFRIHINGKHYCFKIKIYISSFLIILLTEN